MERFSFERFDSDDFVPQNGNERFEMSPGESEQIEKEATELQETLSEIVEEVDTFSPEEANVEQDKFLRIMEFARDGLFGAIGSAVVYEALPKMTESNKQLMAAAGFVAFGATMHLIMNKVIKPLTRLNHW